MTTAASDSAGPIDRSSEPILAGRRNSLQHALVYLFVIVPVVAFATAIPVAWGWGCTGGT